MNLFRWQSLVKKPLPVRVGSNYRYSKRRYRVLFGIVDGICGPLVRLARWLRPPRSVSNPKSILVVQLDHVGDAVLSTPMLSALRHRFPEAAIDVLASEWNREIFQSDPNVRRVHVSHRNWQARDPKKRSHLIEIFRQARLMRQYSYDLGIDPRGDFLINLILWLSGIPRRLGWASGGGGFLLTDVPEWNGLRHEVDSRVSLLEPLGIERHPKIPRLEPGWEDRYQIREALSQIPEARSFIALHVSAGTAAKRWPVAYLSELIDRLKIRTSAHIILIGEKSDGIRSRVLVKANPQVSDWTGALSLMQLAALLEEADLFVGADSGPAHIAASVGTPCVVLFSGTNRPGRWTPVGSHVEVVRWPVPCSPCHLKDCVVPGHPCMTGIRPTDVIDAIEKLITLAPATEQQGQSRRNERIRKRP